ncbi:MAG: hypothetical protein RLY31_1502 [Bacteroidota bacterium]
MRSKVIGLLGAILFDYDIGAVVSGNGPFHQQEISLREHFDNLEVTHLDTVCSHMPCHTHSFEDAGRERGCTDGTGSSFAVVLAVGPVTDPSEAMAAHNTLESFTFRDTDGIDGISFPEDLFDTDQVTQVLIKQIEITELHQFVFGRGPGFFEVLLHRLGGVLNLRIVERHLEGCVAVGITCFDLCDDTRSGLDDCAGDVFSCGIEDTSHTYFLSDYTVHRAEFLWSADYFSSTYPADSQKILLTQPTLFSKIKLGGDARSA